MTVNQKGESIKPVGILGGGLAGVVLQHFLNLENEILEKEDRPGGLCRAWEVEGVVADRGPHIIFSRDEDTLKEMVDVLAGNVERHYRRNAIWYRDRFVKYPFENDIYALDPEERYSCLRDFISNPEADREVRNLEDWAYKMFGPSLARAYFLPYNEKIWKQPARELGIEWVERIPRLGLDEIIHSAVGVPTEGYRHQLYFYHPREGGIESLVKALIKDKSRIRTRSTVTGLKKSNSGWRVKTSSGSYQYEHVVGCLPLAELVRALTPLAPPPVLQAAARLRINRLILVLMVYSSSERPVRLAVYIPERKIWPHRVSWVNYLGRRLVPPGRHAVLAEITTLPGEQCYDLADGVIAEETVRQLKQINLLPDRTPIETHVRREEYAYVVNTSGYSADRATIMEFCRGLGIPLLGRWAEHEYLNMDAVWRRGRRLAAELDEKWGD
jgi:protoporphyrinogen oxidase